MDLNRLIEFNMIAKLGSFTKAAEKLSVSTAVLSARFANFESELGVKLLERSSRSVELTEEGRLFLADSFEIIDIYSKSIRRGRNAENVSFLELRIAVSGLCIPKLLSSVLAELNENYVNLNVSLLDETRFTSWQEMLDGLINIYIGFDENPPTEKIEKIGIGSAELYIIVPRTHPLSCRNSVTLKDLQKEKLLLYPETEISSVRRREIELLESFDQSFNVLKDNVSMNFFFDYISAGIAVGLLPLYSRPVTLPGNLVLIPVSQEAVNFDMYAYCLKDASNPVLDYVTKKLRRIL
ncbi:MAG: LysR family transcriptional regulator [Oscillospiraceae bacterium]